MQVIDQIFERAGSSAKGPDSSAQSAELFFEGFGASELTIEQIVTHLKRQTEFAAKTIQQSFFIGF
jgi:pyocin large subunit-like protein